jgi:hypothetical protein
LVIGDWPPDWLETAWPFRLLIRTNAGVREITIQPPTGLPSEVEMAALQGQLGMAKIVCKDWAEWWSDKLFMPKWWTDPDPLKGRPYRQLWQVLADGLLDGETVTLADGGGQEIMSATAHGGVAQLSHIQAPQIGDGIGLRPLGLSGPDVSESRTRAGPVVPPRLGMGRRNLRVKQLHLVLSSVIAVQRPVNGLELTRREGRPALVCSTDLDVRVYDLGEPSWPTLARFGEFEAARGLIRLNNRLVVWGENTLAHLDDLHRRHYSEDPISGLTAARGTAYALLGDRVMIYDNALRTRWVLELDVVGRHIMASGRTLFVATDSELRTYSLDNPERPVEGGARPDPSIQRLIKPILPNATDSVYVRHSSGDGLVIHAARGGDPEVVARYRIDPWYTDAVRGGSVLVQAAFGGRRLVIWTSILPSESSNGSPPNRPGSAARGSQSGHEADPT